MSAPPPTVNVTICACEEDHVAAITTIYAHHVLHEVEVLRSVGFKFDRWVDSVLMQRALGAGDSTPP